LAYVLQDWVGALSGEFVPDRFLTIHARKMAHEFWTALESLLH